MQKYNILKEYEQNLTDIEDILGCGTTTNFQLNDLCKKLFGDRFVGVFSANDMHILHNNEMAIINTKTNKQPGEHWLALYRYRNKTYVYDSFDRDVKSLSPYFKHKHNWINANRYRQQSFKEKNCGERSVCWLMSFDKNKTKILGII